MGARIIQTETPLMIVEAHLSHRDVWADWPGGDALVERACAARCARCRQESKAAKRARPG